MKLCLIFLLITLTLPAMARESAGVGNGGGTVICPKSTTLLDYYEGQFNHGYTYKKISKLTRRQRHDLFFDRVALYDSYFSKFLKRLKVFFDKKHVELEGVSFVIPDDFKNIFYQKDCKLSVSVVQRRPNLSFEKVFFINKRLWNQIDDVTKDGLIFHEILYMVAINLEAENSREVRQGLAYLMSDQFDESDRSAIREKFYSKVTAGGFFSRFQAFLPIICPRVMKYGFNCSDI
ncbi:MAG: hypothetical protein CME64_08290 [Halobacteriovoraceae bacterium]|nr:hypothetical protein [Halobacteriovoraceae bacterium]|tara:strand:+ start:203642 stop:204343 length:702 start_codon:yes stop_codon:yes gene_type:complete